MRYLLTILVATLLLGAAPWNRSFTVVDGDTIRYSAGTRAYVRLMGFDAPETYRGQYKCPEELALGLKAKARLIELLSSPHKLTIAWAKSLDKYGRKLGTVYSDGVAVSLSMVTEGLGKYWDGTGPKPAWCG